jgi:peroxiredoxin
MLALGTKAPDFSLPDVVSEKSVGLDSFSDKKAVLVMFLCEHCPYVQHVKHELAGLGRDYRDRDVGMVGISANDVDTHPEDSPDRLKAMAEELGFAFPFCYDESQSTAKDYTAACTPDFFVFDQERRLVYRGQLDDSRPDSGTPVTGRDLRAALDAVLADLSVNPEQRPSLGCNIKWKQGQEPSYAR